MHLPNFAARYHHVGAGFDAIGIVEEDVIGVLRHKDSRSAEVKQHAHQNGQREYHENAGSDFVACGFHELCFPLLRIGPSVSPLMNCATTGSSLARIFSGESSAM